MKTSNWTKAEIRDVFMAHPDRPIIWIANRVGRTAREIIDILAYREIENE